MRASSRKRVAEPWDLLRGKDVFRDESELKVSLRNAKVAHWAPNCCTFSRAREKPIPGVANAPKPLRSVEHPRGIPEVVSKLPQAKRRKLDLDTKMADMAAEHCLVAHREGRYFSLEHPRNSLARGLESWSRLEGEEGVRSTSYHACMFHPCRRRKSQILIHNIPGLEHFVGLECRSSSLCPKTGTPHQSWKPETKDGKVLSFATSEEREYPEEFCRAYAHGLARALGKAEASFVEIFSGPNAPLSFAVARVWNTTVEGGERAALFSNFEHSEAITLSSGLPQAPEHSPGFGDRPEQGVKRRRALGASGDPIPSDSYESKQVAQPLESIYRRHATEAGSQPSFGKRLQLIPDGLYDPGRHLELAKALAHPFDSISTLKVAHAEALEKIKDSQTLIARRLDSLKMLRSWREELKESQTRANKSAAWTAKKLGTKINTLLMERVQTLLDIEDKLVPNLCLQGMRITGRAHESPFFEKLEVPPIMSWETFLSGSEERSRAMIRRVEYMARRGSPQLAQAIWEKTQKEVQAGTMGPAMTLEEAQSLYPGRIQVTPSFGLEQGIDASGAPKFRRIDDHSASGVNMAAYRLQKVPMAMVDYVGVLVRALAQQTDQISLATEDMKSAYRQIPLAPADVRFALTAVCNPISSQVDLREMYGQPFGAGHAVPNFCRVAEWIARLLQKLYYILVDHFFDDFFVVEPEITIQSAIACLKESFNLLGFQLDPEKSQPPSELCSILGVVFCTQTLHQQRIITVHAKETRVAFLKEAIEKIFQNRRISPHQAASLVGKFQFLCSTLFGKVGRCCTGALRRRQYASYPTEILTQELEQALELMRKFLSESPSRELRIHHPAPVLLYTDASDVPERIPQRAVGAYIFDPLDKFQAYTAWAVPDSVVARWLQRKSFMGQLELLAAPIAFQTWATRLQSRSIIHFCDNDSASASLIKGYSPKVDSSSLVGDFWLLVARSRAFVYIDRVESKSNLADGPSRFSFSEVLSLGAVWTPPDPGVLGGPSILPASQFGALEQRGES